MEYNKLFEEFPPVSTEKWEETIVKDLKGADYEKKLVWRTIEGFHVKPYYRAEDLEHLEYLSSNPDSYPYVRGKKADNNVWAIRQDLLEACPEQANAMAAEAVQRGATAVGFNASRLAGVADMQRLLQGLNPEQVQVHFFMVEEAEDLLQWFVESVRSEGYDPARCSGSVQFDIYRHALLQGSFRYDEQEEVRRAASLVAYAEAHLPGFRVLSADGSLFHNAGSSLTQELGFALAAANDLLARLVEAGCSADAVARRFFFSFATGSTYFMEIAKLRAARLLWSKVVEQYGVADAESMKACIHTSSSLWNKTVFDPYVNMLRTTTESMSAAIGGADSIAVLPFDAAYKEEADAFGSRIARNQQILLKEESYLDKIVDPAAGSYYVENLTDSMAQAAWQLFLNVEELGGFRSAVKQGYVQAEVGKTAAKRDADIATRKTTILGTNQYPNLSEQALPRMAEAASRPSEAAQPTVPVLRHYRGAEAFEQLRLQTERSGRRPKVFLLTYGNLAMRKARSGFATNFFGVAGYEIVDTAGFKSAAEGAEAALRAQADVVVMCSSDDEYADIAQEVCAKLSGKVKAIVIAGYPKEQIDTYRGYGVDEFIHIKTNALDCLTAFHRRLGII